MMEDRVKSRPKIPAINYVAVSSEEESFQNQTIRPIIKMQHSLLIAHFKHYMVSKKCVFDEFLNEKKLGFIQNSLRKDLKFRNSMIGFIIGHFTLDEYKLYTTMTSEINKRIVNIIIERIKNSMDELLVKLNPKF
jgi:hypothetical protein